MKLTFRLWLFIFTFLLMILAIFPANPFEKGVVIKSIDANSSLSLVGLQKGDVITSINGHEIKNLQPFHWQH